MNITHHISDQVVNQLLAICPTLELGRKDKDIFDFYDELLREIHYASEISGFKLGINTGTPEHPESNFTIITFESQINDAKDAIETILHEYEPDNFVWMHGSCDSTLIIDFPY